MIDHKGNRQKMLRALTEELVGPSPQGMEIDCTQSIIIESYEESFGPYCQMDNREEILIRDTPTARYGVGVLYPLESLIEEEEIVEHSLSELDQDEVFKGESNKLLSEDAERFIELSEKNITKAKDDDPGELDLTSANSFRQSSMGISFLALLPKGSKLKISATGGRYHKKTIIVKNGGKETERTWWLRSKTDFVATFNAEDLCVPYEKLIFSNEYQSQNSEGLKIDIEVFSRPYGINSETRLVTVCLINRTEKQGDEYCLFQSHFTATILSEANGGHILPYPENSEQIEADLDPEEQSIALLYRNMRTFAVGHGCAADWEILDVEKAVKVSAEILPSYETASITPDIKSLDNEKIEVSMAELAGLIKGKDGFDSLEKVIKYYDSWIELKSKEINLLDEKYRKAAKRNMDDCRSCSARMKSGLELLKTDKEALKAFQLANHAMLMQQLHSRIQKRIANFNNLTLRLDFEPKYNIPDLKSTDNDRGSWRAFQIAFLLMSICSVMKGEIPERQNVDLIWFPTGGGKTEAYLGLSAFALFKRRIDDKNDHGVHVIMRYTLRLLTAQQFQRASRLICAMENIRRKNIELLGEKPYSIGIWLGSDSTPNKRNEALLSLKQLRSGTIEEHPFVITQCPWCGAEMGKFEQPKQYKKIKNNIPKVIGYEQKGSTVVFKCPDIQCEFKKELPIYVIDEDIYEFRPSIIIGTVDKFAMLAWNKQVRALFGIDKQGERFCSPPGLIIQDELHLISGPLGSMTGLYELLIEELCTDRRGGKNIPPKIICSTATIRKYKEQIEALYARCDVALFPPPGLDAGDSFFAKNAIEKDGSPSPGRLYVGIHAPGLKSMQTTQVRTFTSLLQAPISMNLLERDPWWTLLLFFNSLRELGTTLTLLQSDIPDRLLVLKNRKGIDFKDLRRIDLIQELTSRLSGDKVTEAIDDLMLSTSDSQQKPIDVCLASSIIEVGVDIERLSLMCIVGQPKTTAQYIQVSGRVGRKWHERPGLVAILYGAGKPRDRSHFERFRSYHEKLYAQVEPTSVTPFSPPVLDRALHAIMVSYVRQFGIEENSDNPYPFPVDLLNDLKKILINRVDIVDHLELENCLKIFEKRENQWRKWEHTRYNGQWDNPNTPLLRSAGSYISKEKERITWATPTSMRNVDAECRAVVTQLYSLEGEENV